MNPWIPITALLVGFSIRWWARDAAASCFVLPAAFASAFACSVLALMSWQWVPQRHWHWLPWVTLLAAALGPVRLGHARRDLIRPALIFGLGLTSAWFLVPTWESLSPPRTIFVPALAVYLTSLILLQERLADRFSELTLLACFGLTALAVALAVASQVSLTYGLIGVAAAAGWAGCLAAAGLAKSPCPTQGLMAAHVIAVAGAAWVGLIEPDPPLYALALFPAVPLLLLALPKPKIEHRVATGWRSLEWLPLVTVSASAAVVLCWLLINGMASPDEVPWDTEW